VVAPFVGVLQVVFALHGLYFVDGHFICISFSA